LIYPSDAGAGGAKKRRSAALEARERVHLVQGNMAGFDLGEKFRLIIIPFRPFNTCWKCMSR